MAWGTSLLVLDSPQVPFFVHQVHVSPEIVSSICGVVTSLAGEDVTTVDVVLTQQVLVQVLFPVELFITSPAHE